jgi:hypothetical protein
VRGTQGPVGDRLPTVAEVDLRMLGVHRAVIDVPYLPRTTKEQEVRDHSFAHRPVVLLGSSMVGKPRLAATVIKDLYADRPILIPDDATALTTLDETGQLPIQPADQLRPSEWDILRVFEKVLLDRDRLSAEDLARAAPDAEVLERIARVGIGEYVGAGQHILDQLTLGVQSHPLGYALLRD